MLRKRRIGALCELFGLKLKENDPELFPDQT
jgi:hypothetical protein